MTSLRDARSALGLVCTLLAGGCYSTGEGPEPPPNALYFPVGILPSPGGKALYVVNSDFDLQFNGGTVEVYNLSDIRDVALKPFWNPDPNADTSDRCHGLGPNPNIILYPGDCGPLNLKSPPARPEAYSGPLYRRGAKIGAFATDLVMACQPAGNLITGSSADCTRGGVANPNGARLFVPVRGDRSLTFFDVDDDRGDAPQNFKLDCGQSGNGACSDTFRAGIDPAENTRGLSLPAEPFGIAISDRADAIVVTHQASPSGAVSLFTGTVRAGDDGEPRAPILGAKPRLEYVLGGLPGSATGIVSLPTPAINAHRGFDVANYQPGFAVSYRLSAQIDVFRFLDDSFAAPQRPLLQRTSAFGLSATPNGSDSRDIVLETVATSQRGACERSCVPVLEQCRSACPSDGDQRPACVERCDEQGSSCFRTCARIPLGVYVSNRSPPALLVGEERLPNGEGSSEAFAFLDSFALPTGPSRVVYGRIHDRRDPPGVFRPRVFVVCFDSRSIIIYDPLERRVDGQIRAGRGPHALVMDPLYPLAYIGHFTDSYIGLLDLDQSHATYGTIVATIGIPFAPKGTK